ncbi:MAG: DEAD/DEAH box helicase, partial [Solirubrobacteraceae bacterium]
MTAHATAAPWDALLTEARADERLVYEDVYRSRRGRPAAIPEDLHPLVHDALGHAGIQLLYEHQARALEAAFAGPTIVTTGTASGKSLCFQLPTLEVLVADPKARALYLYPTKALA